MTIQKKNIKLIAWSKSLKLLPLLLAVFLCTQCRTEKEPEYLLRASLLFNENHTWNQAFVHFAELLEERSNGRLKQEVYHSEQ